MRQPVVTTDNSKKVNNSTAREYAKLPIKYVVVDDNKRDNKTTRRDLP